MKYRLKLSGWHLACSLVMLILVLGGLYLGWYRWPGWYLTNALRVAPILVGVDLVMGPLMTLLIANQAKPRQVLGRDIAMIATVQLAALVYGTATLWHGRPLYYTFSEDRLQLVRASDIDPHEVELALGQNPPFSPHWYSLPRWVWAPLPQEQGARQRIIDSAIRGGDDVIQMPRYFQAWERGLPKLREHLLALDQQRDFRLMKNAARLRQTMQERGFSPDEPVTMLMAGQSAPLLTVFDRSSLQIKAFLRSDFDTPPPHKAK